MVITSTPARQPQAPARRPKPQVYKPLTESWTVGTDNFASTADLLSHASELDGRAAVYHYTDKADVAPFNQSEKVRNAIGAGMTGAVFGAAGGALAGGALAIGASILGVINMVLGSHDPGPGLGIILVPMALGAGGAAIGMGVDAYKQDGKAPHQDVEGQLQASNGQVAFYPHGQIERKVDLNAFQQAPQAPVTEPQQSTSSPLMNTLKGAGAGALLPAASFIPLVGLVAGGAAGAKVGEAYDKRTALGSGLGMVAGVGLTAASYASVGLGWQGFAALSAASAVAGAVVGNKVFGAAEGSQPDFGSQWWNRDAQNQQQN